jgi:hypothetical protein
MPRTIRPRRDRWPALRRCLTAAGLLIVLGSIALTSGSCTVAGSAIGRSIDEAAPPRRVKTEGELVNLKHGTRLVLLTNSGARVKGKFDRIACDPETTLYVQVDPPPSAAVMLGNDAAPTGPQSFPLRDLVRVSKRRTLAQPVGTVFGAVGDALIIWTVLTWRGVSWEMD